MNLLLASTSTLYGGTYLDYLKEEITLLFQGVDEILFIPFARPSGISHEAYTQKVRDAFTALGIKVTGLHEYEDQIKALNSAKGYFTGGGNTFLLVKTLHENNLMAVLKENITKGKPYLGASAGSNIGGLNMRTTNDMPIVQPPSFDCLGLVPFNLNPHYLDPDPTLEHNGETRETRINEFLTQNQTKVVGLREGNWIRKIGERTTLEGATTTRIFEVGKAPIELDPGTEI